MSKKFKPEWEEKCWGRVQHIFANPYAAVSKLEVEAGWMCSRHSHKFRFNMFAMTSGAILVEQWQGSNTSQTLLQAGETMTVPPGVLHRFRVVEQGQLVEVYWPSNPGCVCDSSDIERLDVGGPDKNTAELLGWAKQCEQESA